MTLSVLMVLEGWGNGGTEAYVAQLGEWLAQRGVQPALCLLGGGATAAPWAATVRGLNLQRGRRALGLAHVLRELRPDVCHLHLYSSLLPAALVTRATRAKRLVTTLHMPLWQWVPRHRFAWRAAIALSDAVTAGSRASLTSVGRAPDGATTWLTPPPLHADLLQQPRVRAVVATAKARGPFLVAAAGRLAPEKDWPTLLRAFARLREAAGDAAAARLKLFGAGPLESELRALAATLGVAGAVEMPGAVSRTRLFAEMAEADVFVLPSRFEGLGMVAIEAMALGVPTITADFEASADFIEEGVTGRRFPRGDAEALAGLLRRCLDDPAEARTMAGHGRALVRSRFAEDIAFAPYADVYGWDEP